MESIERFPLNPIEMEAGTDREIEGKSAPMVCWSAARRWGITELAWSRTTISVAFDGRRVRYRVCKKTVDGWV